jgi:serine protease
MAAPHVAATAALVQSVVATPLTPAEMETLLKKTARPFPVPVAANAPIGVGILNAARAVEKALEPPCDPQVEVCIDVTQLFNRVNAVGLSGVTGSETMYSFEAEAGKPLTLLTFGGLGDVTMYVSFGTFPGPASFQHRSMRSGNSETIRLAAPQTGTYYINIVGTRSYSGVTISARQ